MHAAEALEKQETGVTAVDIIEQVDDNLQKIVDQLADLGHTDHGYKIREEQKALRVLVEDLLDGSIDTGERL